MDSRCCWCLESIQFSMINLQHPGNPVNFYRLPNTHESDASAAFTCSNKRLVHFQQNVNKRHTPSSSHIDNRQLQRDPAHPPYLHVPLKRIMMHVLRLYFQNESGSASDVFCASIFRINLSAQNNKFVGMRRAVPAHPPHLYNGFRIVSATLKNSAGSRASFLSL